METQNNEILEIDKNSLKDKIYVIRNQKVMLDSDLAEIYGYTTKRFNQQVKNNIEKFDEDFRFQLTDEEAATLRSKNLTSIKNTKNRGGRTYRPYVFTEQGIYMLMTVLKGELATKQSKALIRMFKEMKDYIINIDSCTGLKDLLKISVQTAENTNSIKEIEQSMVTKEDLIKIMNHFIESKMNKDILILNGQTVRADLAYNEIYSMAHKSIYIIDNYINLKTLVLLKDISNKISVTIFSDNIHNSLHKIEYEDFKKEYPNMKISLKKTNNIFHDRYIILDYKEVSEKIYHCGASSKDAGKRITSITQIKDTKTYNKIINNLLNNKELSIK